MNRMEALNRVAIHLISFVGGLALTAPIFAGGLVNRCEHCGKSCQSSQLVEKTIMCPVKVIETRLKPCLTHSCEEREEKYTAFKIVPENRTIKKECCYLLDEVKSKEITEKTCQVVDVHVSRVKNVKVPQYELAVKTIQKEVCTECGPICTEECCLEEKVRLVDGIVTEQDCEKQLIIHETQKEIFYCVKTPKKQTIECSEETVYKLEPVEKTRKVKVNVPKIEYQPYEVEVTKMLPKKVLCCIQCRKRLH